MKKNLLTTMPSQEQDQMIFRFMMLPSDNLTTENQTNSLSEPNLYDNLSLESFDSLVERNREQMKRREILSKHTPAIKQLPNGSWYTRIDGRKVQKNNLIDVENEVIAYYQTKETTISTLFPDFLERRKKNVADTSWSKDIRYLNLYLKGSNIYEKPIAQITLDDGYQFLDYCFSVKSDMKKKYWMGIMGTVNAFFSYAIDKNYIQDNPFRNLKPKKDLFTAATKTRDGDTVFSKAEQAAVCSRLIEVSEKKESSPELGIILLFNLGLRDGELCGLKWCDLETHSERTYLHVQREMVANIDEDGKAHYFRVLPHCKSEAGDRRLQLNDTVLETFNTIKELNIKNGFPVGLDDYVFQRKYKGNINVCTPRSFDSRLRYACRNVGMDVIKSPHDIRRTVLTNLYSVGMPLKKIQEYAGHASLKQTLDYIRIKDEDLDMLQYLNTLSVS